MARYLPGWSAAQIAAMPTALRIDTLIRTRPCPTCRRYIDNRNWKRHAKSCAAKARKEDKR